MNTFIAHERAEPVNCVWSIAETPEAAAELARRHLTGEARSPYVFECDCLAAWRCQPSFLAKVYHPYRSEVARHASLGYVLLTSRIGETS